MTGPVFSPRALFHLHAIGEFIARDSRTAAESFVETIIAECLRLSRTPRIGRVRPELGRGCRGWIIGSYLIVYRVRGGAVQIVGVIHLRRDMSRLRF